MASAHCMGLFMKKGHSRECPFDSFSRKAAPTMINKMNNTTNKANPPAKPQPPQLPPKPITVPPFNRKENQGVTHVF